MLEVAEHLREIRGPRRQLRPVGGRHAQHFSRDDGWQGVSQVPDNIHTALVLHCIQQTVGDVLDMRAQPLYPARGEGFRCQAAHAGVCRRI